jgi:hypothetical protein
MPAHGLGRLEKKLVLISLCGALVCTAFLWDSDTLEKLFQESEGDEIVIGQIRESRKDVRRRMSQSLTWFSAEENDQLHERDSIFVGPKSSVEFETIGGQKIRVEENSVVAIEAPTDGAAVLNLKVGSMTAKSTGRGSINIRQGGQLIEIKSSEGSSRIHISKNEGGELNVVSQGQDVQVTVDGNARQVKADRGLQIDKDLNAEEKGYPVQITSHGVNETIWLGKGAAVGWAWSHSQAHAKVRFKFSSDPEFKNSSISRTLSSGPYDWSPPRLGATYYVRVVDSATGEPLSLDHKIEVFEKSPLKLVLPEDKTVLFADAPPFEDESRPVHFLWGPKPGASAYKVEVSSQADFSAPMVMDVPGDNDFAIIDLKPGSYFWRVSYTEGSNLPVAVRSFRIAKTERPAAVPQDSDVLASVGTLASFGVAPTLELCDSEVVLQFGARSDRSGINNKLEILNPPKFEWRPMVGVQEYQLEFDISENFSAPLQYKSTEPKFPWDEARPGKYFWRVRGVSTNGESSQFTPVQEILVRLPPPKQISAALHESRVSETNGSAEVVPGRVKWAALPLASGYRVVHNKKTYVVKSNEIDLAMLREGSNTVKVAALGDGDQLVSDFSWHEVDVESLIESSPPSLILPDDGVKIITFDEAGLEPVLFSWRAPSDSIGHEIQFSHDEKFTTVILQDVVQGQQFVLKKPLEGAKIYWRVRSITRNSGPKWSSPRRFSRATVPAAHRDTASD